MTQAGAAAPISSTAADVLTAADSRGPTTEQLPCQQIGGCCSEELSGGLEKQSSVDSEDSGSSSCSSSQAGASNVATNSDDWLKEFLTEYAKAARFSVTNYSHESEGFAFDDNCEEKSEETPEELSLVNDSCHLDTEVGKEINIIKIECSNEAESVELQRSALPCELANQSFSEIAPGIQEGDSTETVNQYGEGKENAIGDGETNGLEHCLSAAESCKEAFNSHQYSCAQRTCQMDSSQPENVLQQYECREDSNRECLTGGLENSALSLLQPCVEVNEELNCSQKLSTKEELDDQIRTKDVHKNQGCVNDIIYESSESSKNSSSLPCLSEKDNIQPCRVDCNSSKTTFLCELLETDVNSDHNDSLKTITDVFPELDTISPQSNDKPKISFQHCDPKNPTKNDITAEHASCSVLPQELKTKVESSQEQLNLLKPTNIEAETGVFVSQEQLCADSLKHKFITTNPKEDNSASTLCPVPQLKNVEHLLQYQDHFNGTVTGAATSKESESEKDKDSVLTLKNNHYFPNEHSEESQNENLPSRLPTDSLPCENVSKCDTHDVKCEFKENFSPSILSSDKMKEEGACEPENREHKINVDHCMEAPTTRVKYFGSECVSESMLKASLFQEQLLDDNNQCQTNNVTSDFTSVDQLPYGVKQNVSKGYEDRKNNIHPVEVCSEVKKKNDLLRRQFFEKNACKDNEIFGFTAETVNQQVCPLKDKENEIPQQMFTNNKGCDKYRTIVDTSITQVESEQYVSNERNADSKKNLASTLPYTKVRKKTDGQRKQSTFQITDTVASSDKQKKNQRSSSKDKSSKRLLPSSRSHKEALLARVTHKQAILKHSPPPLVLLNGAAVDSVGKSVKTNSAADTQFNGQLFREVHELFSGFASSTTDAKSEPICSAGKEEAEIQCHSAQQLEQHRMLGKEQSGSQSSSESATPTNDDPWILSFSDKEVLKASYKVNCKICRKPYNDPRILPCLHTFCAICLDQCESYISSDSDVVCNGERDATPVKNHSPDPHNYGTLSPSPSPDNAFHQKHPSHSPLPSRLHQNSIHRLSIAASPESSNLSTSSSSSYSNSLSNFERKRTILCPLCDAEVDLPVQGAHFLPVNYIAKKQLLDTLGEGSIKELGCDLCSSDSDVRAMYCNDCGINMCPFCSEAHKRQKKTSSHHIVSIQEAKTQGTVNKPSIITCPSHPLEELKLFCETCVQTVCRDCVIVSHRDHICHFISEVSDQQMTILKDVLAQLKPRTAVLKELMDNLHVRTKQVDVQAERTWEQVNTFVDSFIQALQIHRKSLLSQIRKLKCQKQESLTLHRIQVEQALEDLDSSFLFASQLLQLNSEVEFLTLLGPVLHRLRELGKVHLNPEIKNDGSLVFNPFEKAGVVHGFPVLGTISAQQTTSSQCIVKGDGLLTARQGQRSDVFLITRYPDGSLKKNGGENVQAEMISKDTPSKSIPVDVVDCQDGSYLITFCSDTTGLFLLHVTLEGKPVQGSPFVIPVKPKLRQHSGVFHCCTFCSSTGSKEARCACGGTMPGGYKGCGHGHNSHPQSKHWSCCGKTVENSDCSRPTSATYQFTL